MVLRLGGRKLLYALNRHISIPSIRALHRANIFTQLMPSIGAPKIEDVLFNIRSIFSPKVAALNKARPFHSGMSIFWDEVNEEDAACYFPHLDSVGGLCREHSHAVDHAVSIARALVDGTVHYGKEASVVAVGSFGTIVRGAFPILIYIPHSVISAWKQARAAQFGPLWSFASNGDAGRRAMVYQLFMKHAVDAKHALFKYVSRLPGLNLLVGDDDITADFDWKHEIKR
ncbi:hypothetical protein FPV67DRAFT_1562398 [Lyophyllum atratum]|nr:hypothetical protein FPV67DRAFT_1562398 [Lyophyllum atratum]